MKRLTFALKRYESGLNDSSWDALLSAYGARMLSDFAHFAE